MTLLEQSTPEPRAVADKPRLLVLTQVLPYPPDAGPKIKTYNLIQYLARSFAITLVSFTRPDNTPDHIAALKQVCAEVYTVPMRRSKARDVLALARSLIERQPFLMVRDRSQAMTTLLDRLVRQHTYAAVHADQLNMGQYAVDLAVPFRVLDEHNAVWLIPDRLRQGTTDPLKRLVLRMETGKLRRYEQDICRRFSAVLAVTEQDAQALATDCTIIPIGVDTQSTTPLPYAPSAPNLVSIGTMFYPPNAEGALWFGQKVLPLIQAECPQVTYTIIGAKPPKAIYAMAEANPAIQIKGYVPDLREALQGCAGLVVPLLAGGGMRVKILDALALGLPIVSTTIGAEGIALEHNRTALIADTPDDFARACLRLLSESGLGQELARTGRRLAEDVYDFRKAYAPLDSVYAPILSTAQRIPVRNV